MRDDGTNPLLLVVESFLFVLLVGVGLYWSHEMWVDLVGASIGSEPGETAPERPSDGNTGNDGEGSDADAPPPKPAGPELPFEERVRRSDGFEKGSLAPQYRDVPEECGSMVAGGDEERAFPPHETDYRVDITGDLASVVVEQTYLNPFDSTIDAVYQFPLNRRAAVYGMRMRVGDRIVFADIEEEEKAEKIYREANRAGKDAALLSQQRPNWFTQRVANIDPGERVEIELRYVHPVPKEEGAYQFVVPTALADRYGDGSSAENDLVRGDGQRDDLPRGSAIAGEAGGGDDSWRPPVSIEVRMRGPLPLRDVHSPSHAIRLREYSDRDVRVDRTDRGAASEGHFRLRYELAGEEPNAGVNAYWDPQREKGYFSLLLEPPQNPGVETISNREVVFVMDTSGSMDGEPLATSKRFVKRALDELRRVRDSFRIVEFDNDASSFSEKPVEVTEESVQRAVEYVDTMESGGGTEYRPGLRQALQPETPAGSVRFVVFLTDGQIGYEFEVLRQIEEQLGDARLFGIGLDETPNRYLLEEMGRMGRGFARFLGRASEQDSPLSTGARIGRIVDRIRSPVMTHVRIDWGDLDVAEVSPTPVPDVFAGESVRVHGTYTNPGEHEIAIHGTVGAERVSIPVTREFPGAGGDGKAVELTWARQKIRENMHGMLGARVRRGDGGRSPDYYRRRVTDLGLEYSLTTQWTSFVAVSESGEPEGRLGAAGRSVGRGTSGGRKSATVANKTVASKSVNRHVAAAGRAGGSSSGGGGDARGFGRAAGLGSLGKGSGSSKRKERKVDARVDLSNAEVANSSAKSTVKQVFDARRDEIRDIYDKRLKSTSELEGKIEVEIEIAPAGRVETAKIRTSTVDDSTFEQRLLSEIRSWDFPEHEGSSSLRVRRTFVFASAK